MNKEKIDELIKDIALQREEERKSSSWYCPIYAVGELEKIFLDSQYADEVAYVCWSHEEAIGKDLKTIDDVQNWLSINGEEELDTYEIEEIESGVYFEEDDFTIKKVGIDYKFNPIAFYLTKEEAIKHLNLSPDYKLKTYDIGNSRRDVDNKLEELLREINPCYKEFLR